MFPKSQKLDKETLSMITNWKLLTALIGAVTFLGLQTGCSRFKVQSDPPGAAILWSPDGMEPWRPWPPRNWDSRAETSENVLITPHGEFGIYGDTVFITVEKEGYRRPLPQIAQLYAFRWNSLKFELKELPETFRARMSEEGRVPYMGNWVFPEEYNLVKYNGDWIPSQLAEELEMRSRGLVRYDNQWMTPEERDRAYERDQLARGLVLYKDRWMSPDVRDLELAIDEEVTRISETRDTRELTAPRFIGRESISDARVQLSNNSNVSVRILLSGPMSREYRLEPRESRGDSGQQPIFLLPGRYRIVIVSEDGQEPMYASWPLAPGTYVEIFY